MKTTRPQVKIKPNTLDKTIDIIGFLILLSIWTYIGFTYNKLPNTIAIHYNGLGEIDSYGPKWSVIILPIIASLLYGILIWLTKRPHIFSYPNEITTENALKSYTNASKLVRCISLLIVVVCAYIAHRTILFSLDKSGGLGTSFLTVYIGIMFAPLVYFLMNYLKKRKAL